MGQNRTTVGTIWIGLGALALGLCICGIDLQPIEWVHFLTAAAILVYVPWAHSFGDWKEPHWYPWVRLVAALLASASYFWEEGRFAAALTLPWMTVLFSSTIVTALRLLKHHPPSTETVRDCGMLLLPVGGVWLLLSRLGTNPMGFEEPIVSLTAAHFHYTTFVTPTIVHLSASALAATQDRMRRLFFYSGVGLLVGIPLIAAGISLSPTLEAVGALVFASSGLFFAILSLKNLKIAENGKTFIALSSLSLAWTMILAILYGIRSFDLLPYFDIASMVRYHGMLNALGFVGMGLLGWTFRYLENRDHYRAEIPEGNFDELCERLFSYQIFPKELVTGKFEGKELKLGSVIRQKYRVGPFTFSGEVEVIAIGRTNDTAFFTVRTLKKHPEEGVETFELKKRDPIELTIRSTSKPAKFYTCLGYPLLRHFQKSYTKRALQYFGS